MAVSSYRSTHTGSTAFLAVVTNLGAGAGFRTAGGSHVQLSEQDVRRLIEQLEPVAAPPRSLIDDFADLPTGAPFRFTDSMLTHVKVSDTHFTTLLDGDGAPRTYPIVAHAAATTYGIERVDL